VSLSKPLQEKSHDFNSQEIIQDVRAEFEHLLDFVTGEQARTAKADSIERGLFKMLLSLGAKLLQLFFAMRSEICSRQAVQSKSGQECRTIAILNECISRSLTKCSSNVHTFTNKELAHKPH